MSMLPNSRGLLKLGRLSNRFVPLTALHPTFNQFLIRDRDYSRSSMSSSATHVTKKPKKFHKRTKREKGAGSGTTEEVLLADIRDLLGPRDQLQDVPTGDSGPRKERPARFSEVDVQIEMISSTGDGLGFGIEKDYVYVVPFTSPGDKVRAKVITHFENDSYALTDFVKVVESGLLRQDSLIKCPYFAKCSGCQFQMLPYEEQLLHKKIVVERAYRHFSNLNPELIPPVQDTMASPLQYGYRTKLTPHFDGPRNARKDKRAGARPAFTEVPPIGFMLKGTRKTLDIEDCPIGTSTVRAGMKSERERVNRDIGKYTKGATLLLRESTKRFLNSGAEEPRIEYNTANVPPEVPERPQDDEPAELNTAIPESKIENVAGDSSFAETKMCITDNNATSTEYIGNHVFVNPAGAFFQNNNSILPEFTDYVRSLILTPSADPSKPPITHLIDAYCGSGLFTITLSPLKLVSIGIDISDASIDYAKSNADLNNLPANLTKFRAADAAAIFEDVTSIPDQTVVIIDPPRKGCDDQFLNQLLKFGPRRLVYVSCNVHTQARDVAVLVEGTAVGSEGGERVRYKLKTLRGLDFFPQTGHVESVALLERD